MLSDFVLETATNPGTGTVNLAGVPAGSNRATWAVAFATGSPVYYVLDDGTQWETGNGTFTAGSPSTITRQTVIRNSAGTTAKLNFTGTIRVYNALPGGRAVYADANGNIAGRGRRLVNLFPATDIDDGPRWDQVGWVRESWSTSFTTVGDVRFSLPTKYSRFRLEIQDMNPVTGSGALYIRFSVDGGVNYLAGLSDYYRNAHTVGNGAVVSGYDAQSFLTLSGSTIATGFGSVEFTVQNKIGAYDVADYNAAGSSRNTGNFQVIPAGTITNVLIGFVNRFVAGHRIRLLGAPAW